MKYPVDNVEVLLEDEAQKTCDVSERWWVVGDLQVSLAKRDLSRDPLWKLMLESMLCVLVD